MDACGDTPFPHVTALPQGKTEAIINARLESETQYKVNWKTELVSYTQNESGVTSTVRDRETKEDRVVESKYIIGADGSHSMVRKGTEGWLYEGTTVKTKFALADLTIHGDNIENMKDRMNSFMKGSSKVYSIVSMSSIILTLLLGATRCDGYAPYYATRFQGQAKCISNFLEFRELQPARRC